MPVRKPTQQRKERQDALRDLTRSVTERIGTEDYAEQMMKAAEYFDIRTFEPGKRSSGSPAKTKPESLARAAVLRFLGGGMVSSWVEDLIDKTNSMLIAGRQDLRDLWPHSEPTQIDLGAEAVQEPMRGPVRAPAVDPDLAASGAVTSHLGQREKIAQALRTADQALGHERTIEVKAQDPPHFRDETGPLWVRLLAAALHNDKGAIADIVIELQEIEEGR